MPITPFPLSRPNFVHKLSNLCYHGKLKVGRALYDHAFTPITRAPRCWYSPPAQRCVAKVIFFSVPSVCDCADVCLFVNTITAEPLEISSRNRGVFLGSREAKFENGNCRTRCAGGDLSPPMFYFV